MLAEACNTSQKDKYHLQKWTCFPRKYFGLRSFYSKLFYSLIKTQDFVHLGNESKTLTLAKFRFMKIEPFSERHLQLFSSKNWYFLEHLNGFVPSANAALRSIIVEFKNLLSASQSFLSPLSKSVRLPTKKLL